MRIVSPVFALPDILMRLALPALALAIWVGSAAAQSSSSGGTATGTEPEGSQPSANPSGAQGAAGGNVCMKGLMCITAVVNANTTTYLLTAKTANPGYMAMGFGQTMANSPMVIMWANADGSITLSQRQATGHVEPQVVANPPRIATLEASQSNAKGDLPTFAYSIATQPGNAQKLIWAYGDKRPSSADPAAEIQYHKASGPVTLNVSPGGASGSGSSPGTGGQTSGAGAPAPTGAASAIRGSGMGYAAVFIVFMLTIL